MASADRPMSLVRRCRQLAAVRRCAGRHRRGVGRRAARDLGDAGHDPHRVSAPSWTNWSTRAAMRKEWIANLERTERERLDIKSLKVGYNKVFGYYIEITQYPRRQSARRLHPQADVGERRALYYAGPERVRVAGAERRRAAAGDRAAAFPRPVRSHRRRRRRDLLALAAGWAQLDVYAALGRGGADAPLCAPGGGRGAGHRDSGGAASGGGVDADR